jgi:lysophospholipase L1-like esterase
MSKRTHMVSSAIIALAIGFTGAAAPGDGSTTKDKDPEFWVRHITLQGSSLAIAAGTYPTASGKVEVKAPAAFAIDPGEIIPVRDEPVLLSTNQPESWNKGTRLAGPLAKELNAEGSYVPGSISISKTIGGLKLVEGKDYLISPEHGMVGLAPGSPLDPKQPVFASYQYGRLRLDSIVVDSEGQAHLLKGKPEIARPQPPEPTPGSKRLLNIFRPFHATTLSREDIFPILERADQAETRTTRGRIPKTIARIKASRAARIVCLGDSVTAGGNASKLELMYCEVFRRAIMAKYASPSPEAVPLLSINVINESYGGSCSSQWLHIGRLKSYLDDHPEMLGNAKERIDFQRVLDLKPDLVTVEFVNDAPFTRPELEELYGKMADELKKIGAEMILITPHFTSMEAMNSKSLRTTDPRPYVQFLYEFAAQRNLGIADASGRWAHLWKEGIPYVTLLDNSFNHPDDQGHRFFAEEILKNFE